MAVRRDSATTGNFAVQVGSKKFILNSGGPDTTKNVLPTRCCGERVPRRQKVTFQVSNLNL